MRVIDLNGGTEILGEDDCWKLLAGADMGRVAVIVKGRPEIFPVNYEVSDRTIVFRTNMGNKLLGSSSAVVAFEVDQVDEPAWAGWSVVVHGPATEVVDATEAEAGHHTWAGRKDFMVRIEPVSVSGRRLPSRVERERSRSGRTF